MMGPVVPPLPPVRAKRGFPVWIVPIICLVAVGVFTSRGNGGPPDSEVMVPAAPAAAANQKPAKSEPVPDERWEFRLACLNAGQTVSSGDPAIGEFAGVLNKLEHKTQSDRKGLADSIVRCKELMEEKKHVTMSYLEIAHALDDAMPGSAPAHTYRIEEIGAALLVSTDRR